MRIENSVAKVYPHILANLEPGSVYETDKREGYFLATDEGSVVELASGTIWTSSNWAANARYREVSAKVVIE